VINHGIGPGPSMIIKGDGIANTRWIAEGLSNSTFFYAAVDVSDIAFIAGSGARGFNVGFKNDRSACCLRLDRVLFQGWGVGWYTDCAGCNGLSVEFVQCTIGLKLVGYADGGIYTGRMESCVVGAEIGGTDQGSANGIYIAKETHANRLHLKAPTSHTCMSLVTGVLASWAVIFEGVKDVVAVGFPPDVVGLVPGITETNYGTLLSHDRFPGRVWRQIHRWNAESVVSIYTTARLWRSYSEQHVLGTRFGEEPPPRRAITHRSSLKTPCRA